MKRMMHTSHTIHLSDIVKHIDHIVICEDLSRRPYILSSSVLASNDEDELTDEQFLITLSDEQLEEIPDRRIHTFTNLELIGRYAKIDPDLLSAEQLERLKSEYSTKVIIDRKDVEKILAQIQNCNSISYEGQHWKTNKFLKDANGQLRKDDCLDILHQITVEDYIANSRSFNLNHIGNDVIVFEPDAEWETSDGRVLSDIKVYVKLDVDESDGSAIALISMHQAAYDNNYYPYRNRRK